MEEQRPIPRITVTDQGPDDEDEEWQAEQRRLAQFEADREQQLQRELKLKDQQDEPARLDRIYKERGYGK